MTIDEIYRKYFIIVYRYIRAISRDEALSEEITQETFFKAMKHLKEFRGECSMQSWLCQIAKRLWLDHLKKENKRSSSVNILNADDASASWDSLQGSTKENNPEQALLKHSTALRVHTILHKLKEPYKEVFNLRTFGELSFKDIGGIFGKSENWARVNYFRARNKIREELEHENQL